jgi:hypothetical protein
MYVLVRNDLAETYRIVQGSHALAQYALNMPEKFAQWNNGTIIYLGTRNLLDLKEWRLRLNALQKSYCAFYEPDLDGQLTALACFDSGLIFKELKTA